MVAACVRVIRFFFHSHRERAFQWFWLRVGSTVTKTVDLGELLGIIHRRTSPFESLSMYRCQSWMRFCRQCYPLPHTGSMAS